MKITVLDKNSLGADLSIDCLKKFGEVISFDTTSTDNTIKNISDSDCIVINKVKITREIMEAVPSLKLICIFATGYDNVDISAAKELGIGVCNVPGYSTDSVALITLATVLALFTHLREYNRSVTDGTYTASGVANRLTPVFHELKGMTWGIIGAGNIGSSVARIAESFGARVIVNKKTPNDKFNCVDIDTLCRESDIITIHCPLNNETRGLISAEKIKLMKRSVIIVNEARGAVVVDNDITEAIKNGRIGAFGSDVYTSEPFGADHPFNSIMQYDNVLLTPHCAWGAFEARVRCLCTICDNIQSFINGDRLNRVDK